MSVKAKQKLQKPPHDRDAIEALVCTEFCKGRRLSEIRDRVERDCGVPLTREAPYEILRVAAAAGRLSYTGSLAPELSLELRREHPWLRQVEIVRPPDSSVVADRTARVLMSIIRTWQGTDLHVGFAGGGLMFETARRLSALLEDVPDEDDRMPKRLVVHALSAATRDAKLSPNSFLQFFMARRFPLPIDVVPLPMPGLLPTKTLQALQTLEGIQEIFRSAVEKVQVVVTSAGAHWSSSCSTLCELLESEDPKSLELLKGKAIGDVLWQPIGEDGPIDMKSGQRAATLLDLGHLIKLVEEKKGVVVVALAACGRCGRPKTDVLRAILKCRMLSHLVTDARTVASLSTRSPRP